MFPKENKRAIIDEIKICKNFLRDVLEKERWFREMINSKSCDLLLLAGTAKNKFRDSLSDIDIFLVCKNKIQIKYSLKPVTVYSYCGETIEISVVSTEKLFNDQYNKENIFWWNKTSIIKSYNKKTKNVLRIASRLSKKEFLDRIWTNFVNFEINSFNISKQIERKDFLSTNIIFNENVKLVVDSFLVNCGEFHSIKWFGRILKEKNQKMYKDIIEAQHAKNINKALKLNTKLRLNIIKILRQNNFTKKEIDNWEKCNLNRIIFQYR